MIFLERRELLDAFRRGEKWALLEAYRAYVGDVSGFLHRGFTFESKGRRCGFGGFRGGYEIEAAVQEVFRRAFEERARIAYDGIHPYRPYLLRIARNLVINDLKAKQPILFRFRAGRPVMLETPAENDPELLANPQQSAEDLLEAEEVKLLVREFKLRLDPRSLGVFGCRFEQGLSAERTADRLSLTRSQVRTTESKVRAAFLGYMQASGYLEHFGGSKLGHPVSGPAAALVGWLVGAVTVATGGAW